MFPIETLVVGMLQSQLLKNFKVSIFKEKTMKTAIFGKGNVGRAL